MSNQLSIPLDLPDVKLIKVEMKKEGIHLIVESTIKTAHCRCCGKQLTKTLGHDRERVLQHLPVFGKPTYIHIKPIRFECDRCPGSPTTTQRLTWYDSRSGYTQAYEDHLLLQLTQSTVSDVARKEGIGYEAVMGLVQRRVAGEVEWSRIDYLEVLGVDEIALKKGHRDFVTIVVGRQGEKLFILGVLKDREKATVKAFFQSIPKRLRKTLRAVCSDLYEGFVNAAKEVFAKRVKIIVDRFHVAKLYRVGVDQLRKQELKRLKQELPEPEFKTLKGAMWALRRSLAKRTPADVTLLRTLFKHSPTLEVAYYLSGILTTVFDERITKRAARWKIKRWIALVKKSGLRCFDTFLNTLSRSMEEILNYFNHRDNSGFVEGFNNKIKVIKRRCYGILNVKHLFQRISIDLGNYQETQKTA